MRCKRLTFVYYYNNPIELPIQLARFLNRKKNIDNIYNNSQNIHNSNIQLCVKDSIDHITCRQDLPKYNKEILVQMMILLIVLIFILYYY